VIWSRWATDVDVHLQHRAKCAAPATKALKFCNGYALA
jgi:hypothetical protein